MPVVLTLNEALARGEILATNTTESTHVVRVGEWVYKFLKPVHSFSFRTAAERVREIELRITESQLHDELNALAYYDVGNCVISRYVAGREATVEEADGLLKHFERTGRGYLMDVGPRNVRIESMRLIAVDFAVIETHPDWRIRRQSESCTSF